MKQEGWVSDYTVVQFKLHIDKSNELKIFNIVNCEFNNKIIDDTLSSFDVKFALSMRDCPYDNAVVETTYKIIKTEFVRKRTFKSLNQLKYELVDYVNWFNNYRIHSS